MIGRLFLSALALALCVSTCFAGEGSVPTVDDARVRAAGIRKSVGEHLVLYTDLPSGPDVDALPAVFDAAVPQWAAYFGVDPAKTAGWQVRAFLIGDKAKFEALELMPPGQEFEHGFAIGNDVWLFDQSTAYYRRHLLLHEGTHAFMAKFLGGCGPGWYMEGTAELMGTHRFDDRTGTLTLNVMPRDRREVPMWGRIKLIRDAVADGKALSFPAVMELENKRQLSPDGYAWCWAAAKFLDSSPKYRERFRALKDHAEDPDFNDRLRHEFAADWSELLAEWHTYVAALDYGYDFERMAIDFDRGEPLSGKRTVTIAADRGWQSSGVWLEAGKQYRVKASGRYTIGAEQAADGMREWPCEPGGITLEYHDGRPLGELLGAVVDGEATFAEPIAIGAGRSLETPRSGTLYLRVNDSAARLGDNRGTLTIEVDD